MHQCADRYCAKVAEMMNTTTWRSQRPGPAVADDSGPHSPVANRVYAQSSHHREDNIFDVCNISGHAEWRPQTSQHFENEGRDGEAMSILGIHPFLEISETPESPAETFIVSATLCHEANSPQNAVFGEMHPFKIPKKRTGIQSKTAEDEDVSDHSREDDYMRSYKESAKSSPRSVSDSPVHIRARKQKNDKEYAEREEAVKEKVRDIHELMERDEAIESVNFEHISPRRRRQATPEEERRFRSLLGRLQPRNSVEQRENSTPVDPAIISFGQKRKQADEYGSGNFMAQLRAAEKKFLEGDRHHSRSDSGYASPTTYSRPSTRAQSMSRQDTSDDAGAETVSTQHDNTGSRDSGFDSPSKHSMLNPAAKEFSSTNVFSGAPMEQGERAHPPVFDSLFPSPEKPQTTNISFTPARPGGAFQSPGPGFNGLRPITGHMNPITTPGLPQASPGILSQISNVSNTIPQPPPEFGHTGTFPSLGAFPGHIPSLTHPLGLGLPVLAPLPGLMPTSGFVPSGLAAPFHHQLPAAASCNNPAHQKISPFKSHHVSPVPSITPLPPPAPPASLLPQVPNTQLPPPTAPAAPVVVPFIRKNVPKPKVPNTKGQQYWEYVHEMRRMYEPGYAQKSKANQQKRFMKQIHENGDTAGQS